MSQLGMVAHWRSSNDARRRAKMAINGLGAMATTAALGIVMVSKFSHGAWITALVIPGFVLFFRRLKQYNEILASAVRAQGPLDVSNLAPPVVVIPLRRLDRVGQKALRFALTISPDVYVVQVLAEELDTDDLQSQWRARVEEPVRLAAGLRPPELVVIKSPYRRFFERFLPWLRELTLTRPDRQVIVLIPELVQRRWYQFIVSHRAMRPKAKLLIGGGPHVSVMSIPWYPDLSPRDLQSRWRTRRARGLRAEEAWGARDCSPASVRHVALAAVWTRRVDPVPRSSMIRPTACRRAVLPPPASHARELYAILTFSARGPFGPCPRSNVTGCDSRSCSNTMSRQAD